MAVSRKQKKQEKKERKKTLQMTLYLSFSPDPMLEQFHSS
jgi:hypothetical protein